jgi:SPP1 gp7 family putative phage head morphogenesis protein
MEDELVQANDQQLEEQFAAAVAAVWAILDQELLNLVRRMGSGLQKSPSLIATREELLYELLPLLPPEAEIDEIQQILDDLLQKSALLGLDLASELSRPLIESPVAVSVSAGILSGEARRARGYIGLHAESFSKSVSTAIASGLIASSAPKETLEVLKRLLNKTKNHSKTVVVTEAARVRHNATKLYYSEQGIGLVWYRAMDDERVCPHCAAQAGRIFKANAGNANRHYFCRCLLLPYSVSEFDTNSRVDRIRNKHRSSVISYARDMGIQLNDGPAAFDSSRPMPARSDG